jgi:hypothetical protein
LQKFRCGSANLPERRVAHITLGKTGPRSWDVDLMLAIGGHCLSFILGMWCRSHRHIDDYIADRDSAASARASHAKTPGSTRRELCRKKSQSPWQCTPVRAIQLQFLRSRFGPLLRGQREWYHSPKNSPNAIAMLRIKQFSTRLR